ncbi:MAG: DMT family transporter [Burkholderiales bacterium]
MPLSPRLVVLLTTPPLLWAGNAIVGRLTVPHVPPLALNAMRWVLVAVLLSVLGWRALATPGRRLDIARRWPYFAALGLLGTGAYNALQYMALVTSAPINVSLIAASMPVWMMLIGALFFDERPHRRQFAGALCSLLGVALVLARGEPAALADVRFVPGDLLMLLAAACWSGYSWLLVRPPSHMLGAQRPQIDQPEGPRPWNWAEFLLVQALFGVVWAGAAAGVEHQLIGREIEWQPSLVLALVYLAVGPSIIAYWFWGAGVALGGPQLAAFFSNLTPLFVALLSTLLLGDAPHGYHGAAFALIVAGIWLSSRR